jgi:hypothetical protein
MADQFEFSAMDADYLLKHPVLTAAFSKTREDFVQQLELGPQDRMTQDGIMIGLQVLKTIKDNIYSHIEDAAMDKHKTEIEEY